MSSETLLLILLIVATRSIYLLAKRYKKPPTPYTTIAVLVFIFGGSLLVYPALLGIKKILPTTNLDYELQYLRLSALLGAFSVGIMYFILWRRWRVKPIRNIEDLIDY